MSTNPTTPTAAKPETAAPLKANPETTPLTTSKVPNSSPTPAPVEFEPHPHANIFPLMEGDEFKRLKADIQANGQIEPITVRDKLIIDGRNRYRACKELGLTPKTKPYDGYDTVGYVLSANLHRRHLDESQRAMAAAKLVTTKLGANQYSKGSSIDLPKAADMLNVSEASIKRTKDVLKNGTPELVTLVERGEVPASVAQKVAKQLSKKDQAELVGHGAKAIREKAKTLTTSKRSGKSPAQLKKQIDDFEAEWQDLNDWQQRHFVKMYQPRLRELLDELEGLAGMEEAEPRTEASPAT